MAKIAYFHTEFAYSGGAERMVFNEVKGIQNAGHEVTVYTAYLNTNNCYPGEINDFPIIQILPKFLNFLPHDVLILLTTVSFPILSHRFSKHDIYFGANQAGPWWAYMASRYPKKPFFVYQNYPTTITHPRSIDQGVRRNSFVTDFVLRSLRRPIIAFDKRVLLSADGAFSNGAYVTQICEKVYGRKYINCPGGTFEGKFSLGIFKSRFRGQISISGKVVNKPYLLITNRHFPAKRFDYGIKAVQNLDVDLIITGKATTYTKKLKNLAKKLGLLDKIHFVGYVRDEKLKNLYQNACIYLYTAPEEDFGLGVIEAMSYGVPIVAWDSAGPGEIVDNGVTGLLASPQMISDFTNCVSELFGDRELNYKLSKNAYKESRKYSWKKHVDRLLNGMNLKPSPK